MNPSNHNNKYFSINLLLLIPLVTGLIACQSRSGRDAEGMRLVSFEHDGRTRECLVHVPAGAPAGTCPLLIVLHGGGGTAKGLVKLTKGRFNELADRDGFYAVYPTGLGKSWNDFRENRSGYSHRENIDDVGFISALIDRLITAYPIDKNRVFATGMSNGGFMSYRLACELSGKIRGIAAVAATHPVGADTLCHSSRPMSVLIINGTDDPIVPYNGGEVSLFGISRGRNVSTDDTIAFWEKADGCTGGRETLELPDSDPADGTRVTRISSASRTGARVVLYRVVGGGHTWPGGWHYLPTTFIGRTSRDFNACDEIWAFFSGIR
jgi:polyhydroxybutyrate depolymerase